MNQLPAKAGPSAIDSAIHLEFIRAVAESEGGDGSQQVEAFHRAIFLHQHGRDLERCQQQRRICEDRLVGLEARLRATLARLAGEEKLLPTTSEGGRDDVQPMAPWNLWDRVMFGVAALAVVCLLVFGIFNVSFNLLESGIITFAEHPIRAYLWAALLPVGALAVKVGWDFLAGARARNVYLWTCLGIGVAAVFVWVAAYAAVYPTLSKTTSEYLGSLSVFDGGGANAPATTSNSWTPGGAKRIDMVLVAAQALAEIFLSAVLGMYMTQLYTKHRPVRLARNPTFTQFDEERSQLEQEVARERLALADAKGEEGRLEHQLTAFIAYARSLFQREVSLRRDRNHQKQLVLDEIAEQFKRRLAAVDSHGNGQFQGRGNDNDQVHGNGNGRGVAASEDPGGLGTILNPEREAAR